MKKQLIVLLVILGITACISGCSRLSIDTAPNQAEQSPLPTIRVQAPAAPPSIALVPLLKDPGLQITWYKKMDEAMVRIIQREVDISIIPVNSMAILYNKGIPIQLGAVSTWGILYLVSNDPEVTGWQNLRGKKVAVGARGFSPDLVFRALLNKKGLVPGRDVEIIYGSSPEISQMLAAGKLSLAVLPEPLATSALTKNKGLSIALNLEKEWEKEFNNAHGLPQAGLAVSKSFIAENPGAWQEFSEKYAKNLASYMGNPEMVGQAEEKALNLPAAVVKESLSRSNLKFARSPESWGAVYQYLEQLMLLEPEAVGGKVPEINSDFYLKQGL